MAYLEDDSSLVHAIITEQSPSMSISPNPVKPSPRLSRLSSSDLLNTVYTPMGGQLQDSPSQFKIHPNMYPIGAELPPLPPYVSKPSLHKRPDPPCAITLAQTKRVEALVKVMQAPSLSEERYQQPLEDCKKVTLGLGLGLGLEACKKVTLRSHTHNPWAFDMTDSPNPNPNPNPNPAGECEHG